MDQSKVWDKIAVEWNRLRTRPYHNVQKFINYLLLAWKPGKIIDIGCGNCRNLIPFYGRGFDCYGIDFSGEMLNNVKKLGKNIKLKVGNAEKIEYKKEFFDYAIHSSVISCIKGKENRLNSLKEAYRVLRKNGEALITAWNKLDPRFIFKKKDILLPWKTNKGTVYRYYHYYTPWELKRELKEAGFKIIKSGSLFSRNIIFVVRK